MIEPLKGQRKQLMTDLNCKIYSKSLTSPSSVEYEHGLKKSCADGAEV